MRTLQLTQGKVTLVDDADYEWISQWKWFVVRARKRWYAARRNAGRTVYLHRALTQAGKNEEVDHRDNDGLNNQRNNLRLTNGTGNQGNKPKYINNSSGFKGVYYKARDRRWVAQLQGKSGKHYIGCFLTAEAAARAYDQAARDYFGAFALPNFI